MPAHAGYAAALTIHDRVLDSALLSAWRSGQIGHRVVQTFGQPTIPPRGSVNLFFEAPRIVLSGAGATSATLRLAGWGTIGVRLAFPGPSESRTVQWRADLRIEATAAPVGTIVLMTVKQEDQRLVDWQFDVLSGTPFSAGAQAFLQGVTFRSLVESWLRDAIGDLLFPVVDFSFLGPFAGAAFSGVALKIVNGAVLLGFDMDTGAFATTGDPAQLADFAGGDDVATAVNPDALESMMSTARQQVQDQIEEYDATLESLHLTCEEGRFRVTGRASKTGGAVNFSFAVVPRMMYSRPGAFIPMRKKTMVVKARTWPALSFGATEPEVDIDRAWWVQVFGEGLLGVLTLGFMTFAIEALISQIARNIRGGISSADVNQSGPTPLVRRFGDPPTRFAIERFEIHTIGVLIGITSRLEAPSPYLSGLRSVPRNLAGHGVRYEVSYPFTTLADDPFLRLRWTVVDLDSGTVLLNQDDAAAGRERLEFVPAALGSTVARFAVVCRVYRTLGPLTTELFNETIRLTVEAPLPTGAFVRWRYHVKNPVIALDATTDAYSYTGDRLVERWSKFHRADKPCQNARHRSRFVYSDDVLDDLPFPIKDMNGNRYRLCDYCFFGGPASKVATL